MFWQGRIIRIETNVDVIPARGDEPQVYSILLLLLLLWYKIIFRSEDERLVSFFAWRTRSPEHDPALFRRFSKRHDKSSGRRLARVRQGSSAPAATASRFGRSPQEIKKIQRRRRGSAYVKILKIIKVYTERKQTLSYIQSVFNALDSNTVQFKFV